MLLYLAKRLQVSTPAIGKFSPNPRWSNEDFDPVPPSRRTWSSWNYIAYWISDATNVPTWEVASSMLAVGLTWWQALTAIAIGHLLVAIVAVLIGTIGARLHVPFPVLIRSSAGFWLSYFPVACRVILAMFWFGIETYTGASALRQMLKAIVPSMANITNRLPDNVGISTAGMICYLIFWIIQIPFLLVSPQKIRHLFTLKAIVVPCAWIAILIWALVKLPPSDPNYLRPSPPKRTIVWLWLGAMNSSLGMFATVSVNIPDFTRYAKSERAQYVQLLVIPFAFTLTGFIGIAVTAAGERMYGEILWGPMYIIDRWESRPAAFFASFSFLLATLGTNISANSISASNDLIALFPRYINIRRGQIICALIGGWVMCPWKILDSAKGFLIFLTGYTVFLGPVSGIIVVDYWLLHRGKVNVVAMYDSHGIYRYWKGINWRAAVALVLSITPNIPGLINHINPRIDVGNASYLFRIAWLFGFTSASVVYWSLSVLFPASETFMMSPVLGEELMLERDQAGENKEGQLSATLSPADSESSQSQIELKAHVSSSSDSSRC